MGTERAFHLPDLWRLQKCTFNARGGTLAVNIGDPLRKRASRLSEDTRGHPLLKILPEQSWYLR